MQHSTYFLISILLTCVSILLLLPVTLYYFLKSSNFILQTRSPHLLSFVIGSCALTTLLWATEEIWWAINDTSISPYILSAFSHLLLPLTLLPLLFRAHAWRVMFDSDLRKKYVRYIRKDMAKCLVAVGILLLSGIPFVVNVVVHKEFFSGSRGSGGDATDSNSTPPTSRLFTSHYIFGEYYYFLPLFIVYILLHLAQLWSLTHTKTTAIVVPVAVATSVVAPNAAVAPMTATTNSTTITIKQPPHHPPLKPLAHQQQHKMDDTLGILYELKVVCGILCVFTCTYFPILIWMDTMTRPDSIDENSSTSPYSIRSFIRLHHLILLFSSSILSTVIIRQLKSIYHHTQHTKRVVALYDAQKWISHTKGRHAGGAGAGLAGNAENGRPTSTVNSGNTSPQLFMKLKSLDSVSNNAANPNNNRISPSTTPRQNSYIMNQLTKYSPKVSRANSRGESPRGSMNEKEHGGQFSTPGHQQKRSIGGPDGMISVNGVSSSSSSRLTSLHDILRHSFGHELFSEYAARHLCLENVLFYDEVESFETHSAWSGLELKPVYDLGCSIYKTYIANNSSSEVNVSGDIKRALKKIFGKEKERKEKKKKDNTVQRIDPFNPMSTNTSNGSNASGTNSQLGTGTATGTAANTAAASTPNGRFEAFLSLPSKSRRELYRKAQDEVYSLLKVNLYLPFISTPEFMNLKRAVEKERDAQAAIQQAAATARGGTSANEKGDASSSPPLVKKATIGKVAQVLQQAAAISTSAGGSLQSSPISSPSHRAVNGSGGQAEKHQHHHHTSTLLAPLDESGPSSQNNSESDTSPSQSANGKLQHLKTPNSNNNRERRATGATSGSMSMFHLGIASQTASASPSLNHSLRSNGLMNKQHHHHGNGYGGHSSSMDSSADPVGTNSEFTLTHMNSNGIVSFGGNSSSLLGGGGLSRATSLQERSTRYAALPQGNNITLGDHHAALQISSVSPSPTYSPQGGSSPVGSFNSRRMRQDAAASSFGSPPMEEKEILTLAAATTTEAVVSNSSDIDIVPGTIPTSYESPSDEAQNNNESPRAPMLNSMRRSSQ